MDFQKLNIIKSDILKNRLTPKKYSDAFCGLYVEGSNRKFVFKEHDPCFHAFRYFSQYEYPIYLFLNRNHTEDLEKIFKKYENIKVQLIDELTNSFHYNYWMINRVWDYIDKKHQNILTFQSDGFIIKEGWEDYCNDFDYLGAPWKEPIRLLENQFILPAVQIGNGGMSYRHLDKIQEVRRLVNAYGGQEIIKGMFIDEQLRLQGHLVCEDIFFCYFGFGLKIFKPVTIEEANKFSLEPITLACYNDYEKRPFAFHKIDQ